MLRGVEIYKGKPIFYSLGSLLMEFETGSNINTPEMYAAYGFGRDSLPSDLHMSRVAGESGQKMASTQTSDFPEAALPFSISKTAMCRSSCCRSTSISIVNALRSVAFRILQARKSVGKSLATSPK